MGETIHVSKVRIFKDQGVVRRAYIEDFKEPVRYGMHGGIRKFYTSKYGLGEMEELPATLDHVVSAVAS